MGQEHRALVIPCAYASVQPSTKFHKEKPPFTGQLFTLTTKLLLQMQSIPLNSVATHQWVQGFLGHPQEAVFLLIM